MTQSVRSRPGGQGVLLHLAIGATMWIGSPVFAQQGPAGPSQSVDLVADLIYNSNVLGASVPATAKTGGVSTDDEIFQPSIVLDISRPLGRETLTLTGEAGYDFYARNTRLNRENINLSPGIFGQIGPCAGSIGGAFSRAQSSLVELGASAQGSAALIEAQNVRSVEQVSASANCGRATGIGLVGSVSQAWTQNSAPIEQSIDPRTFSATGGLEYRRPTLGSFSLFGSYTRTEYPGRLPTTSNQIGPLSGTLPGLPAPTFVSDGYETYAGGATYSRQIGARLQGAVSVSYTTLQSFGAASSGFSGLTYSANLTYRATQRLSTVVSVSRATVPSFRLNSSFGLDDLYSVSAVYALNARISWRLGGSYGHDRYNGIPYPIGTDVTDEQFYSATGGVTYKLSRRIGLGLNFTRVQRDANYPGLSYPDTRLDLSARAMF